RLPCLEQILQEPEPVDRAGGAGDGQHERQCALLTVACRSVLHALIANLECSAGRLLVGLLRLLLCLSGRGLNLLGRRLHRRRLSLRRRLVLPLRRTLILTLRRILTALWPRLRRSVVLLGRGILMEEAAAVIALRRAEYAVGIALWLLLLLLLL